MAFAPHPSFTPPSNPNAIIWRYMDLAKLISMLEQSSVYFPRVDKLAAADPFEGYYTSVNARFVKMTFEEATEEFKTAYHLPDKNSFDGFIRMYRSMGDLSKRMRETTFVSSWHVLEHESAAMWTLYLRSQDGIAIRSTYQSFVDALAPSADFPAHIGLIRYIDYETEGIPFVQAMFPMMHKRKSFEHEQELRALIWTLEVEATKNPEASYNPSNSAYYGLSGLNVPINLDVLIDEIFVAPSAPSWIVDLVRALVARYGIKKAVKHSQLAALPLF